MEVLPIKGLDLREEVEEPRGELVEKMTMVPLKDDPNKIVQIGAMLPPNLHDQLITFLRENANVFTWLVSNMLNIFSDLLFIG